MILPKIMLQIIAAERVNVPSLWMIVAISARDIIKLLLLREELLTMLNGGTPITITLPSGVTGNKNLIVVAESIAGYVYPIVNIPLNII